MLDCHSRRVIRSSIALVLVKTAILGACSNCWAQESPAENSLIAEMRVRIKSVKVTVQSSSGPVTAEMRKDPVFRYADQIRKLPDATIWGWEINHRPVAICKLERVAVPTSGWQYCFVSLSDQIVTANWSDRFEWKAREPGIRWQAFPESPAIRETEGARLIQMRQLARQFTGVIRNPRDQQQEEMRGLPTPILRFSDPSSGLRDGALFGLTSNGTNPDAVLLLQHSKSATGQESWEYGLHGMTGDEVEVKLQDKIVHTQRFTGVPGNHGTWMWIVFYDDGGIAP